MLATDFSRGAYLWEALTGALIEWDWTGASHSF
jgi:hypothetical protein